VKKTQQLTPSAMGRPTPAVSNDKFSEIAKTTKAIQLWKMNGTLVEQSRNLEFFLGAPRRCEQTFWLLETLTQHKLMPSRRPVRPKVERSEEQD
jgi:hypothetical protein